MESEKRVFETQLGGRPLIVEPKDINELRDSIKQLL